MRSQTLAISLMLLMVAVATLPGISFSLNSSVTSYNNSITLIEEPSDPQGFNLYKDQGHEVQWTDSAFGKGVVQIKDYSGQKRINVAQDVVLSGTDKVYLWVPEGSGASSLTINISYSGDKSAIPQGSYLLFTFVDVNNSSLRSNVSITWGNATSQNVVTISDGHTYLVEAKLHVAVSSNVVFDVVPTIDIKFDGGSDLIIDNPGNNVNFGYYLAGITVESDNHVVDGPLPSCPVTIDNGTAYAVKDSSGHFTSSKSGEGVNIRADASHSFYICVDLVNVGDNKKINSVTVNVTSPDNSSVNQTYTFKGSDGRYVIIGMNGYDQGSLPTTTGLSAYSGVTFTISVSWTLWNGGNTFVDFFMIQVPKESEASS